MEKEVSKAEFKEAYRKYRSKDDGWTDDYWRGSFEDEKDKRYFVSPPESPEHNRLFITSDANRHHMYFLTTQGEESLLDYPGKE